MFSSGGVNRNVDEYKVAPFPSFASRGILRQCALMVPSIVMLLCKSLLAKLNDVKSCR